jgi:hypothetical protein
MYNARHMNQFCTIRTIYKPFARLQIPDITLHTLNSFMKFLQSLRILARTNQYAQSPILWHILHLRQIWQPFEQSTYQPRTEPASRTCQ